MLMPKRVKYRRVQRGRLTGKATRGNKITNGQYGLVAAEPAWITDRNFFSPAGDQGAPVTSSLLISPLKVSNPPMREVTSLR